MRFVCLQAALTQVPKIIITIRALFVRQHCRHTILGALWTSQLECNLLIPIDFEVIHGRDVGTDGPPHVDRARQQDRLDVRGSDRVWDSLVLRLDNFTGVNSVLPCQAAWAQDAICLVQWLSLDGEKISAFT